MKEFLLIFQKANHGQAIHQRLHQIEIQTQAWSQWLTRLAVEDLLSRQIQRWSTAGKIIDPNHIVRDGPYVELESTFGGMVSIIASDYNEALEIAMDCPALIYGGTVEVRMSYE